jgi:hypothetical protein
MADLCPTCNEGPPPHHGLGCLQDELEDSREAHTITRKRLLDSQLANRESLDMLGRRLAECDAYQARGIALEIEIRRLEDDRAVTDVAMRRALAALEEVNSHYGTGLEVANWHMNGTTEPFDNFIEGWELAETLDTLRAVLTPVGQSGTKERSTDAG